MTAYADTPEEVLETIDYLNQLQHQIVQPAKDDHECPICLETYSSKSKHDAKKPLVVVDVPVALPCGHVLGYDCIEQYLSPFGGAGNKCPMCRQKLFEAPYKADTVTKLRARLEAFDAYHEGLAGFKRPAHVKRVRDLLWEFSRTTVIVPEEVYSARIEAMGAVTRFDVRTRKALNDETRQQEAASQAAARQTQQDQDIQSEQRRQRFQHLLTGMREQATREMTARQTQLNEREQRLNSLDRLQTERQQAMERHYDIQTQLLAERERLLMHRERQLAQREQLLNQRIRVLTQRVVPPTVLLQGHETHRRGV
ncbi:MAG: hypothetical protein Q9166_001555 [cf. Caloplaca sp. 2 TL-2023]